MATEVLCDRFTVKSVYSTEDRYVIVKQTDFSSKTANITIDIHTQLLDIKPNDLTDIIIYRDAVEESEVPIEYKYLVTGKMYEVNTKNGITEYLGSFGGLQFVLKTEKQIDLDDNCDFSLGIRKY
ncbi:hypothetical protein GVAV_000823 [Gurleya vavrai]